MNPSIANPYAVQARYTEQRIPAFRNNPLICALPPTPSDEELADELFDLPEFNVEQREWPVGDRLHMVAGLSTFLSPLERHLRLARAFDTLIREGYARRGIRTAEHIKVYQRLYEARQEGHAFRRDALRTTSSQLSAALIGWPGTGKTTAIRRIFARYPEAIEHPEHRITQIPYLHIECPHDGISVKGLTASIFRKLDQFVPDCNYTELYPPSRSAETLLNDCARAMHNHYVGVLVVDEIHNLKNAGKTKTSLMAALVTASNELNVPIVFVGTNKAVRVLGADMSPARRSSAAGFPAWEALECSGNLDEPGEWEYFLLALWRYQWIKNPVPLDAFMSNFVFECTQGIPDIAIKFFACAQWRAMLDGSETFSMDTLSAIMSNELVRTKPMLDAIRDCDMDALNRYEDIAPLHFSSLLDDAMNAYEGVRQRGAGITTESAAFVPGVSSILVEAGIAEERAISMAQKVAEAGKAVGLVEGATEALKLAKPPAPARRKSQTKTEQLVELAPDDYRNAIRNTRENGCKVLDELVKMGAARPLAELIEFE